MKQLDQNVIHEYGLKVGVNWSFNPPTASHMGGVWETIMRTVRKVVSGILDKNTKLTATFCKH